MDQWPLRLRFAGRRFFGLSPERFIQRVIIQCFQIIPVFVIKPELVPYILNRIR